MNALFVATIASLAVIACAAPSGIHGGTIVSGPSGVVTDHGAIGPAGHGGWGGDGGWGGVGVGGWGGAGLGWGGHGAVIAPAVHTAVVAGPAVAAGWGGGWGGWGHGGVAIGHGLGAITNGGGTISVSGHGAAVRGPPTAPVVVAGPSGKVVADGLWGPTANIGLTGGHGHGHGW